MLKTAATLRIELLDVTPLVWRRFAVTRSGATAQAPQDHPDGDGLGRQPPPSVCRKDQYSPTLWMR
ncbi:hypothetical protein [Cupriavidus pinatubonensis]|uniref:hypothetical protein n=1 Tax=Cupriavidus pinatubonensis TaxID=248026 RepID=UPI0036231B5D